MTMGASTPGSARPMRIGERIPVLDSLRGVAILSVFLYHAFFWSGMQIDGWLSRVVLQVTRPGWLGVDLFFVLSGFLITGRLLDRRQLAAREYYRWFYTRRALRILPLYYTTLVVVGSILWWAGATSGSFLLASAFFMPNIAILAGLWTSGPLAVLWSLGIEEQVYLIWPFLVRALTVRRLGWLFVAISLAEPALRYASFASGVLREGLSVATWLRLDGFAWGGLLAIVIRDVRVTRARLGAIGAGAMGVSTAAAAGCVLTGYFSRRTAIGSAAQLACADLFFGALVAVALSRVPEARAQPRHGVLTYFGRISYCLYLVHQFAFWSFDRLAAVHTPLGLTPLAVRAVTVLAVSTVTAELSWRYVEGPSLELKPSLAEPTVVKTA
jgi:peptidoglycan/LPS O-acetylase OafA/YrhL